MTTVVFADLVGSTSMFERLGDETASRFVTQLVGALSQVFEQHSGRVVKLLGDGLFVGFPQEGDAPAACISIQKRFLDKPIRPGIAVRRCRCKWAWSPEKSSRSRQSEGRSRSTQTRAVPFAPSTW